jgi:hypothetical protein
MSATINGQAVLFNGSDTFTYVNGYNGNAPLFGDPATAFSQNSTVHANQLFLNEYGPGTGTFSDLVFSEVPEPSTYALMGLGTLALIWRLPRKAVVRS